MPYRGRTLTPGTPGAPGWVSRSPVGQTTAVSFDVARVRSEFPALRSGVAHFDGPGGAQVPHQVAQAVADTMCAGLANRGSVTAAERRADEVVVEARRAMADLLGAAPGGVVFGRSMTQLTYDLARALAKLWTPGDEVVVTRLDHDANIRPWVDVARTAGATVRWADPDRETGELSESAVAAVLSERTRLVAVTAASNLVGTRPDVPAIAAAGHRVGALVYVDGVHFTPHAPVDVQALGADLFACSPYKFFGPHLGVTVAAPSLLESLRPDKLLPSSDAVPERFELGTLPYEMLAGTSAAVDFIAGLGALAGASGGGGAAGGAGAVGSGGAAGADTGEANRRDRVLASMTAAAGHEDRLFARLLDGLGSLAGVVLHGRPAQRTPTVLFSIAGQSPHAVYDALAQRGVNAPAGTFYALEASRWMGLGDTGGVRAGLAPYTDEGDVDRLLDAVADLCP